MEVDIRKHENVRAQVHAGLSALRVQGRQIWGSALLGGGISDMILRLTIGVGDMARVCRTEEQQRELKKELGNIIFSTIRWIDDLGLDVLECIDLAIEAQEKFAQSGRPR